MNGIGCRWIVWLGAALCMAQTVDADNGPDFQTEVMPVLTKSGCNSSACHGAAIGRGGLRLSLLGYDPDSDFERFVYEYQGRRVNLSHPSKSLVLLKPSRQVKHEGGRRLPQHEEGFRILNDWIAAGAPRSSGRKLDRLVVEPQQKLLEKVGDAFSVNVVAHFNDGTQNDVTRWAVFQPNDKEAVSAKKDGVITARRRGQSSVMVRFLGQVDSVMVTVPLSDQQIDKAELKTQNFVDDFINETLVKVRMQVSPPASSRTFVRRLYLDLLGSLPTPAEAQSFADNDTPERRAQLIEELMDRQEFTDHWSYKWGDLLQIESRRLGRQGASAFHNWVRGHVATNTPLDEMTRQLLLAEGDAFKSGAANFHRVPQDPLKQAEYVSRVFLGVRLQCANCHNHPLDRWTQDDYHGLAAIFSGIRRDQVVKFTGGGEVIHPKTDEAAVPRIPGERNLLASGDSLYELSGWITHDENPFFARAAVNRIWRDLMGRGLVEPVDDHRASNSPTHPELLAALAKEFVDHDFDMRYTIKTIVSSAAYQRSSLTHGNNNSDDRFYAHAMVRPMSPTVMVDAVSSVTGVAESLGASPEGTKAIALDDSRVPSQPLDLLGRCDRNMDCATPERSGSASLPLTLHIINGDWINAKIENKNGRLFKLLQNGSSNEEFARQIYQLAYSRNPTDKELSHWDKHLLNPTDEKREAALKDFLWAVLNSNEFCSNH